MRRCSRPTTRGHGWVPKCSMGISLHRGRPSLQSSGPRAWRAGAGARCVVCHARRCGCGSTLRSSSSSHRISSRTSVLRARQELAAPPCHPVRRGSVLRRESRRARSPRRLAQGAPARRQAQGSTFIQNKLNCELTFKQKEARRCGLRVAADARASINDEKTSRHPTTVRSTRLARDRTDRARSTGSHVAVPAPRSVSHTHLTRCNNL